VAASEVQHFPCPSCGADLVFEPRDGAAGFARAREVIAPEIQINVRNDIGGDEQRIEGLSTSYYDVTFKHLLLPVYAGAYRYNGKLFQILVNGRTGEIQGARPYSFWKIALLVVFLLFVVLILIVVFGDR
jgi:hypothetical protein